MTISETEFQKERKKIRNIFYKGGPMAHNLIQMSLQSLAERDKEAADKIYNEIAKEGY